MIPFYAQDHDYSKYNVLAVDDIPLNLLLVQKMLSRFNFKVRTAANGQLALDAVDDDHLGREGCGAALKEPEG